MSKPIIEIRGVSKSYQLGAIGMTSLREEVERRWARLKGSWRGNGATAPPTATEPFWALRDVSFDVQPGEVVGIIGRNGAGKSTLLKVLSRITRQTAGEVILRGRVASLLEIGTGFHPELSGRDNVFLNGAILGMSKTEIRRKLDEIVAFAEVERFLDTPVKRYSSGMYVRLAFAVAAHLEPDILIVDEVLAVGDQAFQKKCLGKMDEVAHRDGRTVLFVSHNMAAVQNLCTRGVTLRNGYVHTLGSQTEAIDAYLSSLTGTRPTHGVIPGETTTIRVNGIDVVDEHGRHIDTVISGQRIGIRLHFLKSPAFDCARIIASIIVKTQMEVPVFLHHNRLTGEEFGILPTRGYIELTIPKLPLPPSSYRIGFSLTVDGSEVDALDDAVELVVADGNFFGCGEVPPATHGLCLVEGSWAMTPIPTSEIEVASS